MEPAVRRPAPPATLSSPQCLSLESARSGLSYSAAACGQAPRVIGRTRQILSQKQKDRNKLYALHAPEVECLAKGKARTPYEFGVKVSITTHKEGLVIGAPDECDGVAANRHGNEAVMGGARA